MKTISTICTALATFVLLACTVCAYANPLRIYLDADVSRSKASGKSIQQGIQTALAEAGNMLAGTPVELVVLDHRGNNARSLSNLKTFLADPHAFALFTGMHSPPVLAHKQFINESKILTLAPWAAAGPITRTQDTANWIFRLSIDDTKAGEVITQRAIDQRGFLKPALLLEKTGWGNSNRKTMTASLATRDKTPAFVKHFEWGVTLTGAKIILRTIRQSEADVIFLVANAPEGKTFCKAMHELEPEQRLPIISHWGITGGDFPDVITADIRKDIDLEFLQTSFSFMHMQNNPYATSVFAKAASMFPNITKPQDIKAPAGFIHAYDLTKLLLAAAKQSGLTGDIQTDRAAVKNALEHIAMPVQGLIKTYKVPFRPYSASDTDAHEALEPANYTFGKYNDEGTIILIQ